MTTNDDTAGESSEVSRIDQILDTVAAFHFGEGEKSTDFTSMLMLAVWELHLRVLDLEGKEWEPTPRARAMFAGIVEQVERQRTSDTD